MIKSLKELQDLHDQIFGPNKPITKQDLDLIEKMLKKQKTKTKGKKK